MTRLTRSGLLALSVLALSTAVLVAKERPHKFRGAGTLNLGNLQFTSTGNATHMGEFTEVGAITTMVPLPGGEPGEFLISGWATLSSTEDEQELHETFSGQLNLATGAARATITYAGGTGKFTNATGTATLLLQLDLATGAFQYKGTGKIDY